MPHIKRTDYQAMLVELEALKRPASAGAVDEVAIRKDERRRCMEQATMLVNAAHPDHLPHMRRRSAFEIADAINAMPLRPEET